MAMEGVFHESIFCHSLSQMSVLHISRHEELFDLDSLPAEVRGRVDVALACFKRKMDDGRLVELLGNEHTAYALEELDLYGIRKVTDKGLRQALHLCTNLFLLCLDGCTHITDAAFEAVGTMPEEAGEELRAPPLANLRALHLVGCSSLGDEGLTRLAYGCPQLQEVNLKGCTRLTAAGIESLASQCRELVALDMTDLRVCVGDAELETIADYCPKLQVLRVRNCGKVGDAGVAAIARGCPALARADLSCCDRITDDACLALAEHSRRLYAVCLGFLTEITDEGIVALAEGCPLRVLDLEQCEQVGDDALGALATSAEHLERVGLQFTDITDAGVLALMEARPGVRLIGLNDCIGVRTASQRKHLSHFESFGNSLPGGMYLPMA